MFGEFGFDTRGNFGEFGFDAREMFGQFGFDTTTTSTCET